MKPRAIDEIENPFDKLDQDVILNIYQNTPLIFKQYEELGHHLSKMNKVTPRDVRVQYQHLFAAGRKQTEYLYDMAAVSYLVRNFNNERCITSVEDLREMAKAAAGEAIAKLNEKIIETTLQPANQTASNDPTVGPGINKTRSETRADIDTDISEWMVDNINKTGS